MNKLLALGVLALAVGIGVLMTAPTLTTTAADFAGWLISFHWEDNEVPSPPDAREPFGSQYSTFWSPAAGKTISYLVWLPPSYATSTKRYPVVYWLPDGPGRQYAVGSFLQSLGEATATGQAPEMIVIGVNPVACCSFYVNSFAGDLPLESVIINDLLPHVDATYRTLAQREKRAVEGFSMGGYGAGHLGFKYPSLFGAVSIQGGALKTVQEGQAAPCCHVVYRMWNYAFGANEPYFIANSPFTLAQQNADAIRGKIHIRIIVGEHDTALLQRNTDLHNLLDSLGIRNEFRILPGIGHNRWDHYQALGFAAYSPFYQTAFGGGSR